MIKNSVVIPTYNGAHKILKALASLKKQNWKPDEIIVVIDGSTDNTFDLLCKEKASLTTLKIIQQPNGGRAKVRNRGVADASGSLILFLDDDMIVSETWVQEHVLHHLQHPGTILTGQLNDPHENSLDDFMQFRAWLNRRWNSSFNKRKDLASYELGEIYLTANNFSVSKKLFEKLEGFDEQLFDAEDYDLAVRARMVNIPIHFSFKAFAWHDDRTDAINYVKRLREYRKAHQALITLKPELHNNDGLYVPVIPSGIKGFIFSLFCSRWWVLSIDKDVWTWLPSSIRNKLYDVIVTANGSFFPEKVKL